MAVSSPLPAREEYLRKKRNQKILRYSLGLFIFLGLIALSSYIAHRKEIRISKVELVGGVLVTNKDINEATINYLKGSYFWLYPKNNAFWYPKKDLQKYLSDNFKRIDVIEIARKNLTTVEVRIIERKPVATWCDTLPGSNEVLNSDKISRCYFLDQDGTIFAEAPYFSGDAYFKYYGHVSTSTPIGSYYLSSSTEFSEISSFVAKTKSLSIHPLYLIAKDNEQYSLVVEGGGEIYFDTKEPLSKVAQNLEALLRTPALSTSTNFSLPIQYIDLRFGNKLFYKLKGE